MKMRKHLHQLHETCAASSPHFKLSTTSFGLVYIYISRCMDLIKNKYDQAHIVNFTQII